MQSGRKRKRAIDRKHSRRVNQEEEIQEAMIRRGLRLTFLGALLLAAACGGANGAGTADPAAAVERYLQAKVESDGDTLQTLLCSEMEDVLEREIHTFDSVSEVTLEDAACRQEGAGVVRCDGRIVALYGTEETEFPLTAYRVVEEDGEWKWCGEAP
jgi:hypothetical protein